MTKLKWHDRAVQRGILKHPAVKALGDEIADEVAADAAADAGNGATFHADGFTGFDRYHATVRTGNAQASRAEAKRRSLTKAASKKR